MIKEFCSENFTLIPKAIASGARRIELCDNLAVGGTTVSTGVMEETILYCHEKEVAVMAIIRPRGGNFIYTDTELKIMHTDIIEAKKLGVDGVVFGCLNESGWLDEEAMTRLIEAAEGLQMTFHMAFDDMSPDKQFEAIDWLTENGVHRILTHGGPAGTPIEQNLEYINDLISYANNRIIIMPGGGITYRNAEAVSGFLKANELHGTKIVNLNVLK
ncbi:copper homeostasis protein CutC [Vagococcus acidifermentans]|uniref:PF03932 family protein CutC n=1 Tax=Vagococcus acidifermentans TaxID=564710 RepID=A0A430AWL1_9ENTE|nr:copper homeostasis protein CutC [Vagococcus acidifermentans]RSU12433.1 copper homeostasis protein CutC [Vagococcus acidifermentans]